MPGVPGRALPRVRARPLAEPTPPGLVTPWSMAAYDGAVRAMIVGHKDRGQFGSAASLGELLAIACVRVGRARPDGPGACWCRCRPGRAPAGGAATTRWATLVRLAAAQLRAAAYDVTRGGAPGLARRRGGPGRALGAASARPTGRIDDVPVTGACRLARRRARARVVICDDVLTTGATRRRGAASARGRRVCARSRSPPSRRPGAAIADQVTSSLLSRSREGLASVMESVRVRGCVIRTGARAHTLGGQADASRRRNGPRKALARTADHGAA